MPIGYSASLKMHSASGDIGGGGVHTSIGNFNPAPPPSVTMTKYVIVGVVALLGVVVMVRHKR